MDTYSLQWVISACDSLTSTQKLVGLMLALHVGKKSGRIRVSQEIIAQKCSLSERAVRDAIKALVEAGVFVKRRTVRVDELSPGKLAGKVCGIDQAATGSGSKRHVVPGASRKKRPSRYSLDIECSSKAEEIGKYDEAQLQADMCRTAQRHARHSAPTDAPSPVVTSG